MCSNSEKPITGLAISIAPTEGRLTKGFQSGEKKRTIVRIVVADDHPIVRAALKKLLVLEQGFEVVGEASNGREVLERVRELAPDILLLDLRMPDPDGLATLQTLQQTNQRTRVIVMTASESQNDFLQAIKLGCSGIILKQTASDLIAKCIRKVNDGEIWLDTQAMAAVMHRVSTGAEESRKRSDKRRELGLLYTRQQEIVALAVLGYKNREMAERLSISEQTVKNHLHNIFDKLGISGRHALSLYASQNLGPNSF
jgi:DNA-binding NarL/FixJ family response regulator